MDGHFDDRLDAPLVEPFEDGIDGPTGNPLALMADTDPIAEAPAAEVKLEFITKTDGSHMLVVHSDRPEVDAVLLRAAEDVTHEVRQLFGNVARIHPRKCRLTVFRRLLVTLQQVGQVTAGNRTKHQPTVGVERRCLHSVTSGGARPHALGHHQVGRPRRGPAWSQGPRFGRVV